MFKRTLATLLWFLATWAVGDLAAFMIDGPRWVMPVVAVAVATAVWFAFGRWVRQPHVALHPGPTLESQTSFRPTITASEG